jgi:hypothetical protein
MPLNTATPPTVVNCTVEDPVLVERVQFVGVPLDDATFTVTTYDPVGTRFPAESKTAINRLLEDDNVVLE